MLTIECAACRAHDRRYPQLCMAPEGTCSDGRHILRFRNGALDLLMQHLRTTCSSSRSVCAKRPDAPSERSLSAGFGPCFVCASRITPSGHALIVLLWSCRRLRAGSAGPAGGPAIPVATPEPRMDHHRPRLACGACPGPKYAAAMQYALCAASATQRHQTEVSHCLTLPSASVHAMLYFVETCTLSLQKLRGNDVTCHLCNAVRASRNGVLVCRRCA